MELTEPVCLKCRNTMHTGFILDQSYGVQGVSNGSKLQLIDYVFNWSIQTTSFILRAARLGVGLGLVATLPMRRC
jgi:hypothetical protein